MKISLAQTIVWAIGKFPTMEILYDYMNYFDGDANLLCGCDIENQNREDSI